MQQQQQQQPSSGSCECCLVLIRGSQRLVRRAGAALYIDSVFGYIYLCHCWRLPLLPPLLSRDCDSLDSVF